MHTKDIYDITHKNISSVIKA